MFAALKKYSINRIKIINMKFKNITISFLILAVTWLLLNGKYDIATVSIGLVVSLLISVIFCFNCDVFSEMKFTPKALLYLIMYFFVFLGELVKSNFDIARRVVSPSLPINPGIVEVETKLKSKIGRIVLTNSITLTPGTLTIDIKDDKVFVHRVEVIDETIERNTKEVVAKFEKYLEVIYG